MFIVEGKLTSDRPANYAGHQIVATFTEKIELDGSTRHSTPKRTTAKRTHGTSGSDGAMDAIWKPAELAVEVADEGKFTLTFPDKSQIKDPIDIRVVAPDGQVLAERSYLTEELPKQLTLEAQPKSYFEITRSKDPFLGKRVKMTGRVLNAAGKQQLSNKQVVLWASVRGAPADSFTPVVATRTDQQGYFSGDYPKSKYDRAYGEVAAPEKQSVEIQLKEDGTFPEKVILVVDMPDVDVPETIQEEKVCTCMDQVPRAPDSEDLVNSPGTYSVDLVGGKCVDFTAPNRALEEFSYYTLVRTTEPVIKGLTLSEPMGLSLDTISQFADPIFAALGQLAGAPNTGGDSSKTGSSPGVSLAKAVSPSILKTLASDPDNFTPATLQTAQKKTAFYGVTNILDALKKVVPGRAALTATNPVDWDDTPTFYQATTIAHGHLLHFEQVWKADGYSLGDLLYSLPLAPCQKKQIAVIDWDRRERAGRTEQLEEEERLEAMISRDRDISEIVNSTLKEGMRGGSEADTAGWGIGGGAAGSGSGSSGALSASFGAVFGVSGGHGWSSSSAWQKSSRQAAANSMQHLADTTTQSASAVRGQRATVVQTVRQGESMRVQTEVVANHNHCHAITMEYFEVLRHLQVSHELVAVQECLFVPLLMSKFDYHKALRWREPLFNLLRDRRLRGGFAAIERILNNYEGSDLPEGSYAEEDLEYLDGELRISFSIPRPPDKDDKFDPEPWGGIAFLTGKSEDYWYNKYLKEQADKDQQFEQNVAPRVAEELVSKLRASVVVNTGGNDTNTDIDIDASLVSSYAENVPLLVSLRLANPLPTPLARKSIKYFKLNATLAGVFLGWVPVADALPPNSKVLVQSGKVRYRTRHLEHFLFNQGRILNDLTENDDGVLIYTPLDRTELRKPREEDKEIAKRLIAHLNEHIEYYHKAIWYHMDKERRYMLLDGFVAPNAEGRSVASVVENRLIGIVGNCLVMPVSRGFHLDPTYKQDVQNPIDLLNHYAPETPIPPMRISLPTRGVFAEAVMGSCNSCENKEETRFWRFEESPCIDEPTLIQPVSTESRRAEPGDLTPTPFPAPMINLQNAPAAPDPTGLAAALQLLGTPNLFRDITGLDQNQKNALAALQTNVEAAKAFAQEAAKLAQQKSTAQNADKAIQTMDKLVDKGYNTKEDFKPAGKSMVSNLAGAGATGDGQQPVDPQALMKTVQSAASADGHAIGGGEAELSSTAGGQVTSAKVKYPAEGDSAFLGGLGSSPAPAVKKIDTAADLPKALELISKFQAKIPGGKWPHLKRNDVAARLVELVKDADKVKQGEVGLCGPAVFLNVWIALDPLGFATFATDLFEMGIGFIGSTDVAPDFDLVQQDYTKIQWGANHGPVPQADWMVMSSLRDTSNLFFDYEGTPAETWSEQTSLDEIADWLEATNLFSSVKTESFKIIDAKFSDAAKLNPTLLRRITFFIKTSMIRAGGKGGHFINLRSNLSKNASGNVTGDYWTWAAIETLNCPVGQFENELLGWIVAQV